MQIEHNVPALDDAAPDWALVLDDIPCPRCGYNLRELTHRRCPECGLEFRWADVMDGANLRMNPLFEYQWRRRPVKSFLWTSWRLLLPWRIWRDVSITDPPRVGGLIVHLLAALLLSVLFLTGSLFTRHVMLFLKYRTSGRPVFYAPFYSYLDSYTREATVVSLSLLILGGLVWLVLQIFWQTRGAYRIRQGLLLRVTIYTLVTLILSWVLIYVGWNLIDNLLMFLPRPWRLLLRQWLLLWWLGAETDVSIALSFVCLGLGLRRHLKIKHGWRLAVLVVLLTVIICVFVDIQSALYFDTFQNPVNDAVVQFVPQLWWYWY